MLSIYDIIYFTQAYEIATFITLLYYSYITGKETES